ncbi:hypothetical protein CACET_c23860 [Clostridium aceticum]|uniref:Uncharacterized protein n=1 Tax=Clostridium aceticum TaxID=84022 RepID=A0A0D8I595_9CLOT|nr:hypothetical protein [Clostridium aceticum]AKL95832.1 hypothetical protein CACET_c23860 [Clostridium aceticum]KJF25450.1 hypothetical protein TZ02_18560 [Clostridium aceticum]
MIINPLKTIKSNKLRLILLSIAITICLTLSYWIMFSFEDEILEEITKDVESMHGIHTKFQIQKILSTDQEIIYIYSLDKEGEKIVGDYIYAKTFFPYKYKKLQNGSGNYFYRISIVGLENDLLILVYGKIFSEEIKKIEARVGQSTQVLEVKNESFFVFTYRLEGTKDTPLIEVNIFDKDNIRVNQKLEKEYMIFKEENYSYIFSKCFKPQYLVDL